MVLALVGGRCAEAAGPTTGPTSAPAAAPATKPAPPPATKPAPPPAPAAVKPSPAWSSALTPSGKPGPALRLSNQGIAAFAIELPEKASPRERRAAADLARWLKEMGGADFKSFIDPEPRPKGMHVISLGATQLRQAARLDPTPDLGDEGYRIAFADGDLFLEGGRTRGLINAVYALLEEDLGCRWYTRDSATIPHSAEVVLKPVARVFVPKLILRDPYYWDAFDPEWSIRNRTNSANARVPEEAGGNLRSVNRYFAHSFNVMLPPEKYFAEHPEYFSMVNGERTRRQLCMSNAEVLRIAIEEVKKALSADPTARVISVSQNDDLGFCECPDCKKVFEEEGSHSGALLRFVNAVAGAIEKEHPHVWVSTLAYQETFAPPKKTRPAPNVVIQLCTDSHAPREPFLPVTATTKFQDALKGWEAMGARTLIWDYTVSFQHYSAVMPNLPIVADDIRFYVAHGASGVMLEGSYQGPGGADTPLKSWVWAKQLWDPSLETKPLMRDFVFGYYGAAAEPMWDYQMLQWRLWEKEHDHGMKSPPGGAGNLPSLPVFTDAFFDEAGAIFARAEALATDTETRRRVEIAKFPFAYTLISRHTEKLLSGKASHDPKYEELLKWMVAVAAREHIQFMQEGAPTFAGWAARLAKASTLKGTELQVWAGKTPKGPAQVARLNAVWKIAADPKKVGEKDAWFAPAPGFDDRAWRTVRTDLEWGWEHQGMFGYLGEAWYRQQAAIPDDFKARHVYLLFEACDEDAWVYVDGKLALDHSCEKTGLRPEQIWNASFMVDLAAEPVASATGQKTIAVRINNRLGMGGIWKPVYLIASDAELTVDEAKAALKH